MIRKKENIRMSFLIYFVCLGIFHRLTGNTGGYVLEVIVGIVVWFFHITFSMGVKNDKDWWYNNSSRYRRYA